VEERRKEKNKKKTKHQDAFWRAAGKLSGGETYVLGRGGKSKGKGVTAGKKGEDCLKGRGTTEGEDGENEDDGTKRKSSAILKFSGSGRGEKQGSRKGKNLTKGQKG